MRKRAKGEVSKLKNDLWQLCRKIIKLRYPHKCYTCGCQLVDGTNNFHIGHFISSSICSAFMRYYLGNLRPQCSGCNVWKSGNWLAFENHLNQDEGEDYVVILKKLNQETIGRKYDILFYKTKIEEYEKILEELST